MNRIIRWWYGCCLTRFDVVRVGVSIALLASACWSTAEQLPRIGDERAIPRHLHDGEEFQLSTRELIAFGRQLFTAMWTVEDGAGRPLTKGTGAPLSDSGSPLVFPRSFNRVSGPDTNSCSGCHNKPEVGGGGDIVGNVFVLGQRFDSATFDQSDHIPLRGAVDERGVPVTLQTVANSRKIVGMFGAAAYGERLHLDDQPRGSETHSWQRPTQPLPSPWP